VLGGDIFARIGDGDSTQRGKKTPVRSIRTARSLRFDGDVGLDEYGIVVGRLHLSVLIAHAEVCAVLGRRSDAPAVQFGDRLGLLEHLDIG